MFDLIKSVVSRRVESAHDGRLPRGDKNRGVTADCVDQRHVVGLRDRYPPQSAHCLFDGGTGLQHVAQDDGNAKAFATAGSATERQRDRQPVLVHPVQQTPEQVAGPQHPAMPGSWWKR